MDAVVLSRHPIWSATGPFVLHLTARPQLDWSWPLDGLDVTGETAHATLPVRTT